MEDVRVAPRYTCLTCQVAFDNLQIQKDHYRSPWHIYNLKRKVAGLGHVSAEGFKERQDIARDGVVEGENVKDKGRASRGHRNDRDARPQLVVGPDDDESAIQAKIDQVLKDRKKLPDYACFFCAMPPFSSIDEQLAHMRLSHSFVLPEPDYLIDRPGLMNYLADKVALGYTCLYCNGRGRALHSLEAVRKHMQDRGHCKVAYDNEDDQLELSDFYDFTASYDQPDVANEDTQEEGWEDLGEEEGDMMTTDDVDVPVVEIDLTRRDRGLGKPLVRSAAWDPDTMELVLGRTGARLGHRSLARYYRQNLAPPSALVPASDMQLDNAEDRGEGTGAGAGETQLARTRLERRHGPLSTSRAALDKDLLRQGLVPITRGSAARQAALPTSSAALARLKHGQHGNAVDAVEKAQEGRQVMRARNAGEARFAQAPLDSHREQRGQFAKRNEISLRRQGNYQKHFRDHLLQ